MRPALAAVSFLTRVPVGRWVDLDGDDVRRAAPYFPLVGAAVGAGSGAVADRLGAALGYTAATVVTGALHVDALADAADGAGGASRERALEIMRDSRVGAYGVTAIVCDALIRTAALATLAEHGRATRAGVAAGALSRAVPVVLAAWLPYARVDGGTGEAFVGGGGLGAATAGLVAVALAFAAVGADALPLGVVATIHTVAVGVGGRRRLGGVTGDTLGAATEVAETVLLLIAGSLATRR